MADIKGSFILFQVIHNDSLDLSDLAKGVYLLRVGDRTYMVVKE